jgi:hypothetical protein
MSDCTTDQTDLTQYAYLDDLDHIDPIADDACQALVDYLGHGLNYAIARKIPDQVAVRSTRSYDAVDFDTTSFPLLKVFRQKETVDLGQVATVDLVCTYAMMMPDRDQLPGIMHWIGKHIVAMLISQRESSIYCPFRILEDRSSISIEYRIMVDNLNQPAYAYLRVIFSAREIS